MAGERLAYLVTYAANPLVMPVVAISAVAAWSPAPPAEAWLIASTALLFFAVIPGAYLLQLARRGRIASIEIRSREQRIRPLFFGALLIVPGVVAIGAAASTMPALLFGLAASLALNAFLVGFITLWWKISIHAAAAAGVLGLFVGMVPFPLVDAGSSSLMVSTVAAVLILTAVMWSRIRLDAHSIAEVAVGAIFGVLITLVELYFLSMILH